MFLLIGFALFVFSLFDLFSKKKVSMPFVFSSLILLFIICFRYGQGTDYFGYYWLYNQVGTLPEELTNFSVHGELLWRLIESLFKQMNIDFPIFAGIVGFITMVFTLLVIKKRSPYKVLSLFLLYPTFYLTYYLSGIRQGIVISSFLFLGIELLYEEKFIKYFIFTLFLSLIHTSAILLLMLPFLVKYKKINLKKSFPFLLIIILIVFLSGSWKFIYSSVIAGANVIDIRISILGLFDRFIMFFIVCYLYSKSKKHNNIDNELKTYSDMLWKIYKISFIIVCLLFFTSTFSQRMTAPLKVVEVLLIPILIKNLHPNIGQIKRDAFAFISIFLIILSIETYKNIAAFLSQGKYYNWVKPHNAPIVTIFNKDDIKKYRSTQLMELID